MRTGLPTEEEFKAYWKSQSKDSIIEQLWDVILHCEDLKGEIAELQDAATRRNADYLSRCRSVGGVTLPPGV